MKLQQIYRDYFKILILNFIAQIILRLLETFLIIINFGLQESLFSSELLGILCDFVSTNTIFVLIFPLYYLLYNISVKFANSFFFLLIAIFAISHIFILKFYLYQLIPLDSFIYQYSLKEISLTLKSADIGFTKAILLITFLLLVFYITIRYLKHRIIGQKMLLTGYFLVILSLPVSVFIKSLKSENLNHFSKNKSQFFYSQSIQFFLTNETEDITYTEQDAFAFHELNSSNLYSSSEFPLLHKFENQDLLAPYFNMFDSSPNIVILIVEGLNDDFIHKYKGADLMPFLENLKDKSLYWNRCLTLGERSFAVVPSILGSLPYGQKGFSLLDILPRHLSLVSILNSNDYFTSFFSGQGSGFHQNDRFFKYNETSLIFDNIKFSEKYRKIIIGSDNYFWRYNDKDLFEQSLEVIDTIASRPRLDIYCTGTSHSPFIISDEEFYDTRFSSILSGLNSNENKKFFTKNKKYIKSLLFVNDALESFFKNYQKRPEYGNTIFIITGNHPMTEIPITNSLKRYHVPLLIFSERLNKKGIFSNIVSHLDIYETILSFLKKYNVKIPEVSSAMGQRLIEQNNPAEKHIAFMNDNRKIMDYYSDGYYLSGHQIFKVDENLSLTKIDNPDIFQKLQNELNIFKKTNMYVSMKDKILSDSVYSHDLGHRMIFSKQDSSYQLFNSEYYNFINPIKIKNQDINIDYSFRYTGVKIGSVAVVFHLLTEKDSTAYWSCMNLTDEKNYFQGHFKIPKTEIKDSTLIYKSYFWNQYKQTLGFSDLKILLTGE